MGSVTRRKASRRLFVAAMVGLGALTTNANAATFTYSGGGTGTETWSSGANWSPSAPVSDAATTLSYTGVLAASTNIVSQNDLGAFTLNQLNFANAGPGAGTAPIVTISGNPLVFTSNAGAGPVLNFSSTGIVLPTAVIASAVTLSNDLVVTGTTTGTLSGPISGPGGVIKTGANAVTFSGLTSFAGGITAAAGTLTMAGSNSTIGGPIVVRDGSLTLNYNAAAGLVNLLPTTANLTMGGTGGGLGTVSTLTVTGRNNGNSAQTISSMTLQAGRSSISTNRSGTGSMRFDVGSITRNTGAVAAFSTTANSFLITSNTNNAAGILGAWAAYGNDWAAMNGTTVSAFTAYTDLAATAIVSGANTNVRVQTTTAAGAITLSGNTDIHTLMVTDTAARTIDVASGQTLRTNAIWRNVAGTVLTAMTLSGTGSITAGVGDNTPGELIIRLDNAITNNPNNVINVIEPGIVNNGTGAVTLTKTGTSWAKLAGPTTYTGDTYVLQGQLEAPTFSNNAGTVYVYSGATAFVTGNSASNYVLSGTGATNQFAAGISGGVGAIRLGLTATVSGSILLMSDTRITAAANLGSSTDYGTITGQISGNYALSVVNAGTNVGSFLSLANTSTENPNNWTGDTILNMNATTGRTLNLRLDTHEQIPNGAGKGNLIISASGSSTTNGSLFLLNGYNETVNGLVGNFNVGEAKIGVRNGASTPSTLTVGDSNATSTFRGVLANGSTFAAGTLALSKIGTGTLTLTGTSTYTGGTSIAAGVLEISNDGGTTTTITSNGRLSGATSITISGGQLRLTGVTSNIDRLNNASAVRLNGGTFNLNGLSEGTSTAAGVGALTVSADSAIDMGAGDTSVLTFAGIAHLNDAVLTIHNWTGTIPGVQTDRLMFAGVTTDFTGIFDQNEVYFSGYDAGYTATQYGSFYEVTPSAVPEPGMLSLLAVGAAGLLRRTRRRG